MIDVLIIGAGPAGISASLYAKRAGMSTVVLYSGNSNLEKSTQIDNYYGFKNGIDGKSLYYSGIEQAQNLGVELKKEEVYDIRKEDNTFFVVSSESEYEARSVIIATGNKKLRPDIDGIRELEGRGVSYCAICDGFFFRNKNVVVIGSGDFAIKEANELKNITSNVTILTNGNQMETNEYFKIINKKIRAIIGDNKVSAIEFEDGDKIPVDGVFIAIGEAGGTDFAMKIGVNLNGDSIVVDEEMRTNISGLYACGNVTGGLLQICKAVYEGAKAGLSAAEHCRNNW